MSNWYSSITIKIKNKKVKPENIIDVLSKKYEFDMEGVYVNKKNNILTIDGHEGYTITKNGAIPDIEDLFIDITIAYPDCIYEGEATFETSLCGGTEEFEIFCEHGILEIKSLPWASEYHPGSYDSYENFCNEEGDYISEEIFDKYRNEVIIYRDEYGKVYSEEEYRNSYKTVFSCGIKKLIDNKKGINIDREVYLKKIEESASAISKVPKSLKNDREFVLEAVKRNGFAITYIDNDFAHDREIALEAVKSDGFVFDFLDVKLQQDEELIKISEDFFPKVASQQSDSEENETEFQILK
jgi:hypothetical protein